MDVSNQNFQDDFPSGIKKSRFGLFYSSISYSEHSMQDSELSLWYVKGNRGCSHLKVILILEISQELFRISLIEIICFC